MAVTAVIDDIEFRWKDEPRIPDVRGELTDDSVLNPVTFIVTDDVDHPRLEEGQKYQLMGVKDHFYKKAAETQVMITGKTRFEEIDYPEEQLPSNPRPRMLCSSIIQSLITPHIGPEVFH